MHLNKVYVQLYGLCFSENRTLCGLLCGHILQQIDARWIYSLRNGYITYHMFKAFLDLKALSKDLQNRKSTSCMETKASLVLTYFRNRLAFILQYACLYSNLNPLILLKSCRKKITRIAFIMMHNKDHSCWATVEYEQYEACMTASQWSTGGGIFKRQSSDVQYMHFHTPKPPFTDKPTFTSGLNMCVN